MIDNVNMLPKMIECSDYSGYEKNKDYDTFGCIYCNHTSRTSTSDADAITCFSCMKKHHISTIIAIVPSTIIYSYDEFGILKYTLMNYAQERKIAYRTEDLNIKKIHQQQRCVEVKSCEYIKLDKAPDGYD